MEFDYTFSIHLDGTVFTNIDDGAMGVPESHRNADEAVTYIAEARVDHLLCSLYAQCDDFGGDIIEEAITTEVRLKLEASALQKTRDEILQMDN